MAIHPEICRITTILFTHLVEYRYCCLIEPLIFIWVDFGCDTLNSISHNYDSVSS